mmetsp:Transcript_28567/g.73640  ORF Transcript_28567/g.73640 Transcript_28567/m.73640 type:complete len:221 (-) Transcript_28567:562-1224(-)
MLGWPCTTHASVHRPCSLCASSRLSAAVLSGWSCTVLVSVHTPISLTGCCCCCCCFLCPALPDFPLVRPSTPCCPARGAWCAPAEGIADSCCSRLLMRTVLASNLSLAKATRYLMWSSETSSRPASATGASRRREQRMPTMTREPEEPMVAPLSLKPASLAACSSTPAASMSSHSACSRNGSKRSISLAPDLQRSLTDRTTSSAQASSCVVYTHSPPFFP